MRREERVQGGKNEPLRPSESTQSKGERGVWGLVGFRGEHDIVKLG